MPILTYLHKLLDIIIDTDRIYNIYHRIMMVDGSVIIISLFNILHRADTTGNLATT